MAAFSKPCGEESTVPFRRLRVLARARGLSYDACYAALTRLQLWAWDGNAVDGVIQGVEPEILQGVTEWADSIQGLLQVLLDAGVLRGRAGQLFPDAVEFAVWPEAEAGGQRSEVSDETPVSAEALRKRKARAKDSGRRDACATTLFAGSGETEAEIASGGLRGPAGETPVPLFASGQPSGHVRTDVRTCPDRRPDTQQQQQNTVVVVKEQQTAVVVSENSLGSVLSVVSGWLEAGRVIARAWRGPETVDGLIESWKRQRGSTRPPCEAELLNFVGLCIAAPRQNSKNPAGYVFGMLKSGHDCSDKSLRAASVMMRG